MRDLVKLQDEVPSMDVTESLQLTFQAAFAPTMSMRPE